MQSNVFNGFCQGALSFLTIALFLASLTFIPFHDPVHLGESFDFIAAVTVDEVHRHIASMPSKSSSVDFIPTSLLKLCPSVFSELIARLANLSFSEDTFPAKFKAAAVITLLLKKPSLDPWQSLKLSSYF